MTTTGGIVFDPDTAVMRFNDQFAKGETQAGAASRPFRGVELVENMGQHRFRDSARPILNADAHRSVAFLLGRDLDRAVLDVPFLVGIDGIGDEVDEHLAEATRVARKAAALDPIDALRHE